MISLIAPLALALAPGCACETPELLGDDARAPKVYVILSSHIPADYAPAPAAPVAVVVDARRDRGARDRDDRDRPHRRGRDGRGGGGRFDADASNDSGPDVHLE